MTEKLKPCPFCDGDAALVCIAAHTRDSLAAFMPESKGSAYVECTKCYYVIAAETKKLASDKWNTRAPDAKVTHLSENLERLQSALNETESHALGCASGKVLAQCANYNGLSIGYSGDEDA